MHEPSKLDDRPPEQRLAENVGSVGPSLLARTFAGHPTDVQRDDCRGMRAVLLADAQRGLLDVPAFVAECPPLAPSMSSSPVASATKRRLAAASSTAGSAR